MLAFERHVTRALLSHPDPLVRRRAESFVDTSLRAMPEHLRVGVAVESTVLGAITWIAAMTRRTSFQHAVEGVLAGLGRSPIGLLRQYPRLFRSLVVFAECEAASSPVSA